MTRSSRNTRPIPSGGMSEQGFTLIEIMVVLLLIAMVFTLVIPQFQARTHADLKRSALRLAATIEHTFHQSAFRRETLRMHYDLEGSRYWLDRFVDPAAEKDRLAFGRGGPSGKDGFDNAPAGDEVFESPEKPHYVMDRKILAEPVTLRQIKADSKLCEMELVRLSRLSVVPVERSHFQRVLKLGKTRLPA